MDELDNIITGGAPDPGSPAQQMPAQQRTADPRAQPAASLLDTLEHVSISSTAAPVAERRTAAGPGPPPKQHQAMQQVWDDLFADAGATSHAHGGAPPGSSAAQADIKRWFAEADADGDGRVAGGEAVQFFTRTGLPKGDLSLVWRAAKRAAPAEGEGLTQQQFAAALRVVAYAQAGRPLDDDSAIRAAASGAGWLTATGQSLPPPRIAPLGSASAPPLAKPSPAASPVATLRTTTSAQPRPGARGPGRPPGAVATLSAPPNLQRPGPGPAMQPPSVSPSSSVSQLHSGSSEGESSDDEGLGAVGAADRPTLKHAQTVDIPRQRRKLVAGVVSLSDRALRRPSPLRIPQQSPSFKPLEVGDALLEPPPLAVDVRQPPLHPKRSAALRLLAAGNGSLFAAPAALPAPGAAPGAFIQWAGTSGALGLPHPSSHPRDDMPHQVATEDSDAAPGWEVPLRDVKPVTSVHVDVHNDLMWTGHTDGWVCGYTLGEDPGAAVERRYCFAAFRGGSVTAMCATAWGDLWVANSRGGIRIWPSPHEGPAMGEVEPRELRRGASGNRPHGGRISALALPLTGQVMWSCSGKTICLWSADTGAWLGKIGGDRELEEAPAANQGSFYEGGITSGIAYARDAEVGSFSDQLINSAKGLDLDAAGGVTAPGTRLSREEEIRRQHAWAEQTDTRLAGVAEQMTIARDNMAHTAAKAGKFLKKLHNRIAARVEGESASSASGIAERPSIGEAAVHGSNSSAHGSQLTDEATDQPQGHGDIRALIAGPDGYVWACHKHGLLERYTASGCLQWFKEMTIGVRSAAVVGERLWVGLADGAVRVFETGPKPVLLAHFSAHDSIVVSITQAGRRVFTLGADGSVRGWSAAIPCPADDKCREELERQMSELVMRRSYACVVLTWNVNEQRPEDSATFTALRDTAKSADLVAVGLQEIEMGGGSVAIAAVQDAIARGMLEKGNANAVWWAKRCLAVLGGGWDKVGLRQLSGMLVIVFAREELREVVGEVATASVATGVLGVGGNKGAVAIGFTLHRRRVAFLASHFAAHQGAVEARNANYAQITAQLAFKRGAAMDEELHGGGGREVKHAGSANRIEVAEAEGQIMALQDETEVQGEGVGSAELLVWMGDFNYRIMGERDAVVGTIRRFLLKRDQAALQQLLTQDQLRREMAAGNVFRFMHEAAIGFAPTYKFDKGDPAPLAYDSSEKQRVPAWCDRILFRGSELTRSSTQEVRRPNDPDVPEPALQAEEIRVGCRSYFSVSEAAESDHKPVLARLAISMPVTDQAKKRSRASAILAAASARAAAADGAPAVQLSSAAVTIEAGSPPAELLFLHNTGTAAAAFSLAPAMTSGVTRDGLPSWLMAHPSRGVLRPGERCAICLGAHPSHRSRPLQARLAVRVLPLASIGGPKDALQQLRLSVTCAPTSKRSHIAPSLRQDAVSYGGTYSAFGRWDD